MKILKLTFPNKTAKEIMDNCDNTLGTGKLLYNTEWYKKEYFFTKEKCRSITVEIEINLIGKNNNWNECAKLVKKKEGEMLNLAEMLYFYQQYFKETGKYIDELEWSWTSARSSRGRLVGVGFCDSGGVLVGLGEPGRSSSFLGVRFSRSVLPVAEAGQAEAIPLDSLKFESRIKSLESDMEKIKKFLII